MSPLKSQASARLFKFSKWQGAGNDFVFTESPKVFKKSDIQKICDRHFGIGSDGMVFIHKEKSGYEGQFFNPDGSKAGFCGNAARCFAGLIFSKTVKFEIQFKLNQISVTAKRKSKDKIEVQWTIPEMSCETLSLVSGGVLKFVQVSVPHVVLEEVESLTNASLLKAKQFRSEKRWGSEGTNVTYFRRIDAHKFEAVTYERGVEDFTLACGTGAVAVSLSEGKENRATEIIMPGGILTVFVDRNEKFVSLSGDAKMVFEGTYRGSM